MNDPKLLPTGDDLNALIEIREEILPRHLATYTRHHNSLDTLIALLTPPENPDPLHVRAREAIERLGLDGSRLELAVSVFGWGSDEANGLLLGMVRKAWGDEMAFGAMNVPGFSQRPDAMVVALEVVAP